MTLIPHLSIRNAAEAYEFYQKAFDAKPLQILTLDDGRVMHGALDFGGSTLFIAEEFPEHGGKSPEALGGSPVNLHLHVSDCDAVFNKAIEAGCTVSMPLEDMFWGDRYGSLRDPYGHVWSVATTIRQLSPEEMKTEMDKAMAGM
jgi:PhnB protein